MTHTTSAGAGPLLSADTLPLPQPGLTPVPARLGQTVTGTAAHTVIDLAFNTAMKAGSGTVFITDGSVQTVLDLATGQPALRIVGATSTLEIPAASLRFDGQHVLIDAYDLTPGLNYSVVMAAGTLLSSAGKSFAGVRTPGQLGFVAAGAVISGPTLDTIEVDGAVAHAGADLWVSFTFSERVRQPDPTAFSTPNASLTDWRSDDGLTWSARLVGSAGVAVAANQLTVDMSKIRSLDDHPGRGTPPAVSYGVDTVITSMVRSLSLEEDTGPWHDDLITSGAAQLFQGVINGSLSPGQQFELIIDGVAAPASAIRVRPFGEGSQSGYSWSAGLTLAEGSHTVLARIADLGGHSSATVERTVVIDNSAPQMTSSASGATAFALDAAVVIRLNEALHWEPSEGLDDEITVEDRDGNISYLPFSLAQWSNDQRTLTLPASLLHLTAGNDYTIRLPESLTDLAGNGFGSQAIRLHTAGEYVDLMPPRALTAKVINPAGSYGVGAEIAIHIQFNEAVTLVNGATPVLVLNNGATARLQSINSDHEMVFLYVVAGGDAEVDELDIADDGSLVGNVMDLAGLLLDRAHIGYHVLSNDSAANHGSDIQIVTRGPTPPGMPALDTGSDSGVAGDGITSATLPTFHGNGALPGATVIVYDGATEIARGSANGSGAWSLQSGAALREGEHSISVRQADGLGNMSQASAPLSLQIDLTAATPATPALDASSDSGARDDGLTGDATPTIVGHGVEAYASVDVYVDDVRVETVHANAGGEWSYTLATQADGEHRVRAAQLDSAGNRSDDSATFTLRIDTVAPGAPGAPLLDASSNSGNPTDLLTNDATPGLAGGGAQAHATVEVWDGLVYLGSTVADDQGAWRWTSTTLVDGLHRLSAYQVDAAGNRSSASDALVLTIDTGAAGGPGVPQLARDSDSNVEGDHVTNENSPAITGDGAEAGATVELYDGGILLGTGRADGSGAWTIDLDNLADRQYSLTARQVDAAGNRSVSSAAVVLTIDTHAASAPTGLTLASGSDSGTAGDNLTSINAPEIHGGGAEAGALVELFIGERRVASTIANGAGQWSATLPPQADGTLTLRARQTDTAGNTSVPSAGLTITIDSQATAPAGLALATASDSGIVGDGITRVQAPTIHGTGAVGDRIDIFLNQSLEPVGHTTVDEHSDWSFTFGPLGDGQHVVTARASDAAGNVASSAMPLVIDTFAVAPALAPQLLNDSGVTGDGTTNQARPTFSGDNAEPGATINVYLDEEKVWSTLADRTGSWTVQLPAALAEGSYGVTVTQTDPAGNESGPSPTLYLRIDLTPPPVPQGMALDDGSNSGSQLDLITNDDTPTISGTSAFSFHGWVELMLDGQTVLGRCATNETGAWSITSDRLGDGEHVLQVRQIDAAGNASALSSSLVLNIDTTPPATLGKPRFDNDTDNGDDHHDGITSVATPALTGDGATPGAKVAVFAGGLLLREVVADNSGAWHLDDYTFTEGRYAITARQTDTAGNLGVDSEALTVTVDLSCTAPTIRLDAHDDSGVSDTDGITNHSTLHFSGEAEAGATVFLSVNGERPGSVVADENGKWAMEIERADDGPFSVSVMQHDAVPHEFDVWSDPIAIRVDRTAPTPLDVGPDGLWMISGENKTIQFGDLLDLAALGDVQILDARDHHLIFSFNPESSEWGRSGDETTLDLLIEAAGDYLIHFVGQPTDLAGNVGDTWADVPLRVLQSGSE